MKLSTMSHLERQVNVQLVWVPANAEGRFLPPDVTQKDAFKKEYGVTTSILKVNFI